MTAATTSRSRRAPPGYVRAQTATHDYGALEQRVYGTERKIDENFASTTGQINNLAQEFRTSIVSVLTKIDNQQQQAFNSGKTQWLPLLSVVTAMAVALGGAFITIGSMALGPQTVNIARHEVLLENTVPKIEYLAGLAAQQARNLALQAEIDGVRNDATATKVKQAYLEGKGEAEHNELMRTTDRLEKRTDTIDGQLVKRPELDKQDAHNQQRQDALSARFNGLEEWLRTISPGLGDVIKEIQNRLDRLTFNSPPPVGMITGPTQPPSPQN